MFRFSAAPDFAVFQFALGERPAPRSPVRLEAQYTARQKLVKRETTKYSVPLALCVHILWCCFDADRRLRRLPISSSHTSVRARTRPATIFSQTTPMPPAPICSTMRQCDSVLPIIPVPLWMRAPWDASAPASTLATTAGGLCGAAAPESAGQAGVNRTRAKL